MRFLLPLLLLFSCCPLTAQELSAGPDLGIPAEVRPAGQYATLKPKTSAKAITYIGMSGIDPLPADFLADPRWFLLDTRGLPVGRYLFNAVGSENDVHTRVSFEVIIGNPPPGPGPAPNPLDPVVVDPLDPERKPIADGFRYLIVWEDEMRAKLPPEQLYTIIGKELSSYLDSKCEKDETGRADWHLYDDDFTEEQINLMPERWRKPYRDSVTRFRKESSDGTVPVVLLSNTRKPTKEKGILTILPKTKADILAQAHKYGDN